MFYGAGAEEKNEKAKRKQKNYWQKNKTPSELAAIFLPDIFLLSPILTSRTADKSFS
jgi:hypothetical protein